jgi:hypothetical protein
MPRINFYRSLLFLIRVYSNLLALFNKKGIVFLFSLIRFHILSCEKTEGNTKKCKRCLFFCCFPFEISYGDEELKKQCYRKEVVATYSISVYIEFLKSKYYYFNHAS